MKTQQVVLAFMSLLLFACPSSDDDSNNNNPQQVEFTATNYLYEGNLRLYYLETRNTELESQIEVWEQVPDSDPGYNDAQASIAQANEEITSNNEESNTIITPTDAFLIVNPIPPIPPAPSPCICLDVYNTIENLVFQSGNDIGSIEINSSDDQSVLVDTANTAISTIANTDGLGTYQPFNLTPNNFTGEATITVHTDNGSYSILANFHDL